MYEGQSAHMYVPYKCKLSVNWDDIGICAEVPVVKFENNDLVFRFTE